MNKDRINEWSTSSSVSRLYTYDIHVHSKILNVVLYIYALYCKFKHFEGVSDLLCLCIY